MNGRQIGAMWLGIVAIGALLLFPPCLMMPNMTNAFAAAFGDSSAASSLHLVRYGFLFHPPSGSIGIDWPRYILPVVVVALVTLGLVVTLQTRPIAPRFPATE